MWPLVALLLVIGAYAQEDCICLYSWYCQQTGDLIIPSNKCNAADDEVCCKSKNAESTVTIPMPNSGSVATPDGALLDYGVCGIKRQRQPNPLGDSDKVTMKQNYSGAITWKGPEATDTIRGEFPWVVEITARNDATGRYEYKCGGTIIHHNLILTTAHNILGLTPSDLTVNLGAWDISDSAEPRVKVDVSNIFIHPDLSKEIPQNDVAILVLKSSLQWSEEVAPVCLPDPALPYNDKECIAIGWGKTKEGLDYPKQKEIHIPLVEHARCQSMLRKHPSLGSSFPLHESFLCGGGKDYDTCEGAGGGPLMCPVKDSSDQKRYVQIGITSWGIKNVCYDPLYPGVYSNVAHALQWINQKQDDYPDVNSRKPPS